MQARVLSVPLCPPPPIRGMYAGSPVPSGGNDGNDCNLPTHARPGSEFAQSFSSCKAFLVAELYMENGEPWNDYYCTYNPSNNMNDLHYV
ncbi:hypothetical protein [Nonomuraea sp. NPDC050691]|uniref:hypothetical protein n=1 Tax=Nonomuraea sp. NPDC050691 TaxID=3155661 RepID=UPI0033FFC7DA